MGMNAGRKKLRTEQGAGREEGGRDGASKGTIGGHPGHNFGRPRALAPQLHSLPWAHPCTWRASGAPLLHQWSARGVPLVLC